MDPVLPLTSAQEATKLSLLNAKLQRGPRASGHWLQMTRTSLMFQAMQKMFSDGHHIHRTFDIHMNFSQTDPACLEIGRNGRRSNFPSSHSVQRGAMDSSDWSNFGSPSTSLLIDIETIELEATCPNRWCHRHSSVLYFTSSGNFRLWCFRYSNLGGVTVNRIEGTRLLYSHYVSLFSRDHSLVLQHSYCKTLRGKFGPGTCKTPVRVT